MKGKIFINGRGGCGKSTFISLIAKELSKDNKVLIIDMDEGNLGLNKMLNVDVADTSLMEYYGGRDKIMGEILKVGIKGMVLEKINLKDDAASDSIDILDNMKLSDLSDDYVTWKGNIGFIESGKINDPDEGCACPMGNLTRDFLNHIVLEDNEVVLVDTSAGIEHIGRGVIESADKLISIVDPSGDAILLANKIGELSKEASKDYVVILNKIDENTRDLVLEQLDDNISVVGELEYNSSIAQSNLSQKEINLDEVESEIKEICEKI